MALGKIIDILGKASASPHRVIDQQHAHAHHLWVTGPTNQKVHQLTQGVGSLGFDGGQVAQSNLLSMAVPRGQKTPIYVYKRHAENGYNHFAGGFQGMAKSNGMSPQPCTCAYSRRRNHSAVFHFSRACSSANAAEM